jgi:type IV pilus assembly protein PilY1
MPTARPLKGEVMTQHTQPTRSTRLSVRMFCAFLAFSQTWVLAAPAQKPLLTASSPPLPNVVLTLDDSGSMNWHMMPDSMGDVTEYSLVTSTINGTRYTKRSLSSLSTTNRTRCTTYFNAFHTDSGTRTYYVDGSGDPYPQAHTSNVPGLPASFNARTTCYTSANVSKNETVLTPGATRRVYPLLHPNDDDGYPRSTADTQGWNISGVADTNLTGFNGVFNAFAVRFRSVDFNGNYYNPAVTYVPWPAGARNISSTLIDANGYPLNASQTPIYPEGNRSSGFSASTATVNLVATQSITARWCAEGMTAMQDSGTNTSPRIYLCQSDTRTFKPAVYFKLKTNADGSKMAGTSAAHFDAVYINEIGTGGITKPTSRTDCTGSVCTQAQELRNFATWYTYYRNRTLVAKGAVALAFDRQPKSKFRLGWGSINNSSGNSSAYSNGQAITTDGYANNTLRQGVRPYTDDFQGTFFNWLRPLPTLGGTPLQRAMDNIGKYYSDDGKAGGPDPYREVPTDSAYSPLSCRRNYHILVTDGYWNGTVYDVGNADGTSSDTAITNHGKSPNFTYSAVSPFKDNQSGTLADLSMYYWKRDLRSDLNNDIPVSAAAAAAPNNYKLNPAYWQHMQNFTVGLGVDGQRSSTDANGNPVDPTSFNWPTVASGQQTTIDDLWHAAVNSRGQYLKATDPIAFADALGNILSKITSTGGTVSGVTVSNGYVADNTLKLVPSFEPERWSGELKGVKIDASGNEKTTPAPWLASEKLPAHALRNIWMGPATGAAKFLFSNLPSDAPLALGHVRTSGGAGVAPVLNENLVNYLRGDTSNEGDDANKPYRPRTNALGAFVNSLPVYIKDANFDNVFLPKSVNGKATGSGNYNNYVRNTKRVRNGLAVIGGNDGMLHGFRATDGVEVFAYIPKTVLNGESHPLSSSDNTDLYGLARLSNKGYNSLFFMDGQIAEGDVSSCTTSTGTDGTPQSDCSWRNMVVATAGGGAKSVFALDVTSNFTAPTDTGSTSSPFNASNVMWELDKGTSADLGYVMSTPQIGLMASGEWAVIFGNGYNSTNGKATLFIVNAKTGALIKTITVNNETSNGLGGVRLVRNLNNVIVQAYAGDLKGNVWKFDLTSATATDWKVDLDGVPLFTATRNNVVQPITAAPNFALHPKKGLMVYVSTGKLTDESDLNNNTQQTIYGLWDQADIGASSTSSNQVPANKLITQVIEVTNESTKANTKSFNIVADSGNASITDKRGWKLDMLFANGERGIYSPKFLQGYVFVQTVRPGATGSESCSIAAGTGYGYLLNMFSGAKPTTPILDLNGNGTFESTDTDPVFKVECEGICEVQKGSPYGEVISTDKTPPTKTQSSDTTVDRSWRQIFWLIN